ncbi:MAG: hypothetical protein EAX95_03965 [Candidatus Thorarchaeota archaeon]|nr:hypothetical protein [Candidatus Thorarchaeota archaeon]
MYTYGIQSPLKSAKVSTRGLLAPKRNYICGKVLCIAKNFTTLVIQLNEDLDLKQLEQATFRVANQDGLTEILMGLMILAVGLLLVNSISVVYVALLIVFQAAMIERFRERYTYPRIGRVKLREDTEQPYGPLWAVFGAIMLVALSSVILSVRVENEILHLIASLAPLIMAIGLIQPFVFLAQRSGLRVYYGFGAIVAVLGAVLALVEFPLPVDRMVIFLLCVGGLLCLTGLASLLHFIRKYPVLNEEAVDVDQEQ